MFSGANSSVVFSLFTLSDVLSERLRHHGLNYDGNDRVISDVVLRVHVERISMPLCLRFDISLQAASFWDETILLLYENIVELVLVYRHSSRFFAWVVQGSARNPPQGKEDGSQRGYRRSTARSRTLARASVPHPLFRTSALFQTESLHSCSKPSRSCHSALLALGRVLLRVVPRAWHRVERSRIVVGRGSRMHRVDSGSAWCREMCSAALCSAGGIA